MILTFKKFKIVHLVTPRETNPLVLAVQASSWEEYKHGQEPEKRDYLSTYTYPQTQWGEEEEPKGLYPH